jgi:hypothetical protein
MGGPAEMAFGWPLVTLFTLTVALSMAELASALPTAGAMYHWSSKLGGKGWGWFTAWFNMIGNITVLAGIDYGCALFLTPLLGFDATTLNLLLVYAAILISHALINHFGIRLVARLNDFSVTVHIIGVIAIVAALFIFAPKQPARFFFTAVTNNPQGSPYWWAFIIGLLQAQWTFTGYDASASVSEETVDPRRRVPWGMVMAPANFGQFGGDLLQLDAAAAQWGAWNPVAGFFHGATRDVRFSSRRMANAALRKRAREAPPPTRRRVPRCAAAISAMPWSRSRFVAKPSIGRLKRPSISRLTSNELSIWPDLDRHALPVRQAPRHISTILASRDGAA